MDDQVLNEILILDKFKHPNIIELQTYFEDSKHLFLVMELAERTNLFHKLKDQGNLTEEETSKVAIVYSR